MTKTITSIWFETGGISIVSICACQVALHLSKYYSFINFSLNLTQLGSCYCIMAYCIKFAVIIFILILTLLTTKSFYNHSLTLTFKLFMTMLSKGWPHPVFAGTQALFHKPKLPSRGHGKNSYSISHRVMSSCYLKKRVERMREDVEDGQEWIQGREKRWCHTSVVAATNLADQ